MTNARQSPPPAEADDEDITAVMAEHQLAAAADLVVPGLGLALEILSKMFELSDSQAQLQPGISRRRAKLKTQAALRL